MKNNFFEIRCSIDHSAEQLSIKIPHSCRADFERTISNRSEKDMMRLVELFAELKLFDIPKRQTFQALIEERADNISTLDDILALQKVVRLLGAFDRK